jgi:hypothetical protein
MGPNPRTLAPAWLAHYSIAASPDRRSNAPTNVAVNQNSGREHGGVACTCSLAEDQSRLEECVLQRVGSANPCLRTHLQTFGDQLTPAWESLHEHENSSGMPPTCMLLKSQSGICVYERLSARISGSERKRSWMSFSGLFYGGHRIA